VINGRPDCKKNGHLALGHKGSEGLKKHFTVGTLKGGGHTAPPPPPQIIIIIIIIIIIMANRIKRDSEPPPPQGHMIRIFSVCSRLSARDEESRPTSEHVNRTVE